MVIASLCEKRLFVQNDGWELTFPLAFPKSLDKDRSKGNEIIHCLNTMWEQRNKNPK